MDYYEKKMRISNHARDWLGQVEEAKKDGLTPPPFSNFSRKMLLDYGFSAKAVIKLIEELVPGGTIREGEIVKK